jgi:hypothetical protein
MKILLILFLISSSLLFGEFNFPKPSIGVAPIVLNDNLVYFSGEKSVITIINSRTDSVTQVAVSQRVISMFVNNNNICVITVDGHMQIIDTNGNITTKKILDNGGVISAASIGNHENFVLLAFQDGDQGLKIILYSKQKDKYVSKIIKNDLPKGVLTSGRGMVWFNSEQKSFEITAE